MNTEESVAAHIAMIDMLEQIAELPRDEETQFIRAILMVGSCFLNKKNHGVFCLVENEDTLKVMGVNASLHETGHIVGSAAECLLDNLNASDLHRKGETH